MVWNIVFFHFIYGIILPIDELHHFSRWVGIPPTRISISFPETWKWWFSIVNVYQRVIELVSTAFFPAGSVRTWTSSTPWKPPPRPGAWRPTSRSPSPRRRSSSSSTEPRWMGNRRGRGWAGFGTWKCWGKHGQNVVKHGETWYIKLVCEHWLPLLMSFGAIQTKNWGMIRMIRIHPVERDEATDSSGDVHRKQMVRSWCSY